jgi:hypothetical protein
VRPAPTPRLMRRTGTDATEVRDDVGNTVGPFGVDHNDRRRPLRDPERIDAHDVTEEEQ